MREILEDDKFRLGRFLLWISAAEFPPDDDNPNSCGSAFAATPAVYVGLCHVPIGNWDHDLIMYGKASSVTQSATCKFCPQRLCSGKILLIISIMPVKLIILIMPIISPRPVRAPKNATRWPTVFDIFVKLKGNRSSKKKMSFFKFFLESSDCCQSKSCQKVVNMQCSRIAR